MNARSISLPALLGVIAVAAWPSTAMARSKDEVLASMKGRYAALRQAVSAGKVGETHKGLVDAVKASYRGENITAGGKTATVGQLVDGERADRTEYFAIAAKDQGTTPAVVAKSFAARKKSRLKSGEYWKKEDGAWVRKK